MARPRKRLAAGDRVPRRFDLLIPGLDGDAPRAGRSHDRLQLPTRTTDPAVYNRRVDMLFTLHERLHDDALRALQAGLLDVVALDRAYGDGRDLSGVSRLLRERQEAARLRAQRAVERAKLLAPLVATYLAEEGGRSIASQRAKLERFMAHLGGPARAGIADVTRNAIAAFLAQLTLISNKRQRGADGAVLPGQPRERTAVPVSGSTYNRYLDTVRGFCSWAVKANHLAEDPYAKNAIPKKAENMSRLPDLTPAEYRDYVADVGARYPQAVLPLQLLAHTGIDVEELYALRAMDVLFTVTAARLRVRRNKTRTPERQTPVPAFLVAALRGWIALHGYRGSDRIFATISYAVLRNAHEHARAAIHRPELRMKDFRHISAIYWRRAKEDLQTIQKRLGHASIAQTMIYTDFGVDDEREAPGVERAAAALAAQLDVPALPQLAPATPAVTTPRRRRTHG